MAETALPTLADWNLVVAIPVSFLALYASTLVVVDLFIADTRKIVTAWLALLGLAITFVLQLVFYNAQGEAFFGLMTSDGFSNFFNITVLITTALGILLSVDYLKRKDIERGEFYSLLLIVATGIMFMGHANDLIVVFVALELLSIPLYILAAFGYPDPKSEESGVKYFILGAFASAFFVYGSALIYGGTGSTSLPEIFASLERIIAGEGIASPILLLLGTGMVLVGLGFKVAVVPFHMWTPDVYEGAPTPVTAFMSVGAKAGGFAALTRIMVIGLPAFVLTEGMDVAAWQTTVVVLSALTLILGNTVAIVQTNIKRMLAYSSIANAGYIMMAVAAAGTAGLANVSAQAVLVYILAYAFTNLGAFAVVLSLEDTDGSGNLVDNFRGLAKSQPLMAAMMTVFMLSLTGIPLTGGFIGKYFVFSAALQAGLFWLTIIGVLTTVISAFFYLRIVVNMYLRDRDDEQEVPVPGATTYVTWAMYAAFAGTLLLGIFPILATNLSDMATIAANIVP